MDIESIWSVIKGTEIILDQRRLGHLFEMPSSRLQVIELWNDFNGMQRLLGWNIPKKFDIHNANFLFVELKLLYSMISKIFFSRIRRFDWISSRYLGVMVHMVKGTTMNLPFMMIEQMKIAVEKSKSQACLPYGMVFTLIFMKAGIDLDGEDCKALKHTDFSTSILCIV